jgi:hypothetical protein
MNELAEAIPRTPDDPQLPWKMGQLFVESQMTLLASRCFEAALALDPNYQPARASLAALRADHPELAHATGRSVSHAFDSSMPIRSSRTFP